jgi:hypothetical protein
LGYKPGVGIDKRHPDGARYRPKGTEDERANFYWEVANLNPLTESEWISITSFLSHSTGKPYAPFPPRRPLLVQSLG